MYCIVINGKSYFIAIQSGGKTITHKVVIK
jgi:hypothetical protein|nr:MAG TPA: GINGIPAIN R2 [Caudoviricetes sp.]